MENKDEQFNNAIKDIKKIKMTPNEKSHILESILSSQKTEKIIKQEKIGVWSFFTNYSFYMRTAVYFILLASVGGLFWFNYQGNDRVNNTAQNIYQYNSNVKYPTNNNLGESKNKVETTNDEPKKNGYNQGVAQTTINTTKSNFSTMSASGQPVMVYKTKKDYSSNIRVCYNNGEITCFPGPTDIVHQRPTKLENGYFLNKMSGNVVLNVTIDELINYGDNWPDLMKKENIIDYKPFSEIYSCPPTWGVEEINNAILNNRLKIECENTLDN